MHKGSAFRNTKLSTLITSPLSLSISHGAALAGMFETVRNLASVFSNCPAACYNGI